jgi:hypothetical protein
MVAGSKLIMTAVAAAIVRDRAGATRRAADLTAYNAYLASFDRTRMFTASDPR